VGREEKALADRSSGGRAPAGLSPEVKSPPAAIRRERMVKRAARGRVKTEEKEIETRAEETPRSRVRTKKVRRLATERNPSRGRRVARAKAREREKERRARSPPRSPGESPASSAVFAITTLRRRQASSPARRPMPSAVRRCMRMGRSWKLRK